MNTSIHTMENSKTCAVCNKLFIFKRDTARYCCDACRKQANRVNNPTTTPKKSKKRKSAIYHLAHSLFGEYLVKSLKNSGTVQVIPRNSTVEDISELLCLYKQRVAANGTGIYRLATKDQYEICHLSPANGRDGSKGLLTATNLVVAPRAINHSLSNNPTIYSSLPYLSIPSTELKDCWRVTPNNTAVSVIKKLNRWLGGTLAEFQKKYKLKAYNKGGNGHGFSPTPANLVMQASLEHIQKHHGLLFKPASGKNDLLGVTMIVPAELAPLPFPISTRESYKYLLTGEFRYSLDERGRITEDWSVAAATNGGDDWGFFEVA